MAAAKAVGCRHLVSDMVMNSTNAGALTVRDAVPCGLHPTFRTRARSTARILPWLLLCLCTSAHAFSGWEHETLSQLSLLVASNHVSVALGASAGAGDRLSAMREVVSSFHAGMPEPAEWRKATSRPITYGDIAMLVDYMKDPYDMLHLPHSRVTLPVDAQTANLPYLRSLLEHGSKVISLASASHEAYNHFQGRALDAFCTYHKLAVAAASETNLWGALMLSAYAIHFLEDTFAPGHLLTPRDADAHDLNVALMHDAFNEQGLTYVVQAPQQLTDVAGTADRFLHTITNQWQSQDGRPKHVLSLGPDTMDTFCDRLASDSDVAVFCLGDDQLIATKLQPALMLVYCSRAIDDVLESYVRGYPTNSFSRYVWDRRPQGTLHGVEVMDMRLPYGELTCSNRAYEPKTVALSDTPSAAGNPATNYPVTVSLTRPIYRNPGIGFSFGFESVSDAQETHLRGLLEAEALVTGGRRDIARDTQEFQARGFPQNLWPRSWGLTLGYSGLLGVDDTGQGGYARVIWPIAPLNLQISAQVGGRYYWGHGVQGIRDFEMLRVDWGLHMLTIFVGVGHDYYTRPNAGLYTGLSFEAGISLAMPYSKLKNLGSLTD
jgi:hypothetical protein